MSASIEQLNEYARDIIKDLLPVQPDTRYWEFNNYQYHYTTERVDGKFWAMIYKPVGEGARTGKPKMWKLQRKVSRVKRKDAKALALKWYMQARKLS